MIERSTRLHFAPYPTSIMASPSTSAPTSAHLGSSSYAAAQDFDYPFATPSNPSPNLHFLHDADPAWMRRQRGWTSREARSWDWRDMLEEAVRQVTTQG